MPPQKRSNAPKPDKPYVPSLVVTPLKMETTLEVLTEQGLALSSVKGDVIQAADKLAELPGAAPEFSRIYVLEPMEAKLRLDVYQYLAEHYDHRDIVRIWV